MSEKNLQLMKSLLKSQRLINRRYKLLQSEYEEGGCSLNDLENLLYAKRYIKEVLEAVELLPMPIKKDE